MINLKLDEQQAFFLTQLFENILSNYKYDKLFYSLEENERNGKERVTFDSDFKEAIQEIEMNLLSIRGFNNE